MLAALLLFVLPATTSNFSSDSLDESIHRILYKRNALKNMLRDEPNKTCRNGGILTRGECHCPFPHTGPTCQEFDCQNGGISVGRRYDPHSFLFSKPCLCNNGYNGELCQYRLENRCGRKGEYKNGRCHCIEFFFGDYCQFTSHCIFGTIKHGRCICHRGYEGDYCQKIVCYHGYTDIRNQSHSCICPAKYKGLHCDECAQAGKYIAKYPICVYQAPVKTYRVKNTEQTKSRITIMAVSGIFLLAVILLMILIHLHQKSRKNPEEEEIRMREWNERKRMLAEAALKSESEPEEEFNRSRGKKISFASLFRRKPSSDGGRTSVFQRFRREQSMPNTIVDE